MRYDLHRHSYVPSTRIADYNRRNPKPDKAFRGSFDITDKMQRQSRQIDLGMPRKRNRSTSLTYKFLGCVFSGIGKTLDPLPGGIYGSCVNTADFCALGARHERVLEAKLVVTIGLYDIHHIDTCDCRLQSILSCDSIITQLDSQGRLSKGVEIPCLLHDVTTRRSSVSCLGFSKQGSPERFQLARLWPLDCHKLHLETWLSPY